jgi:hypothetical protein
VLFWTNDVADATTKLALRALMSTRANHSRRQLLAKAAIKRIAAAVATSRED